MPRAGNEKKAYAARKKREGGCWYFIAEQPPPAPHLAHPEGCATLRIVLVPVPRVSRSCKHFLDGFDLHLLLCRTKPNIFLRYYLP